MKTSLMPTSNVTKVINFAKILPLFQPIAESPLIPARRQSREVRLARTRGTATLPIELDLYRPHHGSGGRLRKIETASFAVPRGRGNMFRNLGSASFEDSGVAELDLPIGMPRFVNAATLKRMLKARSGDLLLKKSDDGWEICADSLKVDLLDDSVEFRLGPVQIYS